MWYIHFALFGSGAVRAGRSRGDGNERRWGRRVHELVGGRGGLRGVIHLIWHWRLGTGSGGGGRTVQTVLVLEWVASVAHGMMRRLLPTVWSGGCGGGGGGGGSEGCGRGGWRGSPNHGAAREGWGDGSLVKAEKTLVIIRRRLYMIDKTPKYDWNMTVKITITLISKLK